MILDVPIEFRPKSAFRYPPNNEIIFEQYFYNQFIKADIILDRIYIPIFWTNYYIHKNYGNGDLTYLQNFIDSINLNRKYFTIVQYDDNILNNLGELDVKIFTQGGYGKYKDMSYAVPLNCQIIGEKSDIKKSILASFVGRKTHKIRNQIFENLQHMPGYFISEPIDYSNYTNIMSQSIFSLCPRGYGLTSFRIFESLFFESIPVYIYDEPLIPFSNELNFNDFGILIHINSIKNINEILKSKTKYDIESYIYFGKIALENYFSYDGCYNAILNILKTDK